MPPRRDGADSAHAVSHTVAPVKTHPSEDCSGTQSFFSHSSTAWVLKCQILIFIYELKQRHLREDLRPYRNWHLL